MRSLVAFTLTFGFMAAPAQAYWTNDAPATDPRSKVMQTASARYWDRVLPGQAAAACPGGITRLIADMDDLSWAGGGTDCLTAISRKGLAGTYRLPRRYYEKGGKALYAALECAIVTHEDGHAIGLEHEDDALYPVMDWQAPPPPPPECFDAARVMYPRDTRHIKARWLRDMFGREAAASLSLPSSG